MSGEATNKVKEILHESRMAYYKLPMNGLKSIQVNSRTNSNEVLHVQPQIDQNNYKKDLPHTGFEQAFSAWQSSTFSTGPQRLASK